MSTPSPTITITLSREHAEHLFVGMKVMLEALEKAATVAGSNGNLDDAARSFRETYPAAVFSFVLEIIKADRSVGNAILSAMRS